MLGDRDYMRAAPSGYRDGSDGMKCLFFLIGANAAVYFLIALLRISGILGNFVLTGDSVRNFELWRFATAAFTHADFWHIFFNMFGLYMFGSLSAPVLGWKKFLLLYLVSGVLGNVLWYVFNIGTNFVLLGASGAVVGVIMATAMMMPDIKVLLLFFPVPIKLKTMAIVYIILEIFQQQTMHTNIAYLAHIGGFIAGFLFMELFARREIAWSPLELIFGKRKTTPFRPQSPPPPSPQYRREQPRRSTPPKGWTVSSYDAYTNGSVSRNELDRILDKISKSGINSLSEAEMETLRSAREQMKLGQSSR